MKKNIINILIIILTIGLIVEISTSYINEDNNNILEEVETKDVFNNKDKTLSIVVIDENGNYEENTSRTLWPDSNTYEYYGSECTDSGGSIIPSEEIVTFENNKVHIKTKNTIYCTLYFYNLKTTALLQTLYKTTGPAYLKTVQEDNELLRYIGTKDDANNHLLNNYICFGTNDESTCTSNKDTYLYRIIGITTEKVNRELGLVPNQLKIIKATPVKENGSVKTLKWANGHDATYCGDVDSENGKCKWDYSIDDAVTTPTAQYYINNIYLPTIASTLPWNSIIDSDVKWYIGGGTNFPSAIGITDEKKEITGKTYKTGLMYASDYYFSWTYKLDANSWLHLKNGTTESESKYSGIWEWTMTRYSSRAYNYTAYSIAYRLGNFNGTSLDGPEAVRPVFYLIPSITLTGKGTEDDPFIISV